ncbi:MAG: chromosome partitioning protein [Alphaproteobacteria bacterium HGW-Alphaproteobacteria-2]|nr:MAG: chromosome partitioning protein [Alphaproteobacteria bacterium HGW-Alphaproteobacteria-2]
MERLQEALARAREQRRHSERATPGQADAATPEKERPAPARQAPAGPRAQARWEDLAPLQIRPVALKRHRVLAHEGGRDAAPYDLLRTKIMYQAKTNNWRRIAIVSPDPACGKTTTLANLAFSFERQRDMRVMIIDLDLRRPMLQAVLSQDCDHSMADVLERRLTFAEHGRRLGARVALGLNGSHAPKPAELLLSQQSREVLAQIEADYAPDLMLFDISPLSVSDDNIAFLQNVDCAVIVAAAEETPVSRIDQAERQVAELTNVMGVVLNKCRYEDAADSHGYYY